MTLLAGIISRRPNQPLPATVCESLRRFLSRNSSDEPAVFEHERGYLVYVDIGAYGEPGFKVDEGGALTLLAGEPLLGSGDDSSWRSREDDLASIHEGCARGQLDVLRKARGVFCAVHYQPASNKLYLMADKLGLRPLYYWADENYVVFSSALRILEEIAEVPKKMDVRALTEMVGLGYPLGGRTPYAGTFLLKAAEAVEITDEKISSLNYWRWDDVAIAGGTESELIEGLYGEFESAVRRRSRRDTTTVAYLSGGLDSRCVVAALRSQNVRAHTFNFARPRTQDQIFGLDFARQIDAIHEEVPKKPGDHVPDYSSLMAEVWAASVHRRAAPAERPALVWSGEGGSVALGHVHLNQKIVDLMRSGEVDAAVQEFTRREYVYVPPKLFRPEVFAGISGVIDRGIREELDELHAADPARNFYLFLMLNDQRRKLGGHFENIDLHRLEFQLPFFDSDFLAAIVALPLDICLRHELYVKWLGHFHPAVTRVPWQSYPGHAPCPLPIPQGLAYQWAEDYQTAERATQKQRLLERAAELLRASDFPEPILSKRNLRLAAWIHSRGWRDYEHVIKAAGTFHTYWKKCDGQYALASN